MVKKIPLFIIPVSTPINKHLFNSDPSQFTIFGKEEKKY